MSAELLEVVAEPSMRTIKIPFGASVLVVEDRKERQAFFLKPIPQRSSPISRIWRIRSSAVRSCQMWCSSTTICTTLRARIQQHFSRLLGSQVRFLFTV